MNLKFLLRTLFAIALLAFTTLSASAALQLNFSTTIGAQNNVYVAFQTTTASTFSASYVNTANNQVTPIILNILGDGHSGLSNSIPLSSISGGIVTVNYFDSGVIYASVGGPLGTTAAPSPTNPTDPGYNFAWQAVAEITYTGNAADSGDTTSINFFSLPSQISVISNNEVVQQAGTLVPAVSLVNQIAALTTTPSEVLIKATQGSLAGQTVRALAPNQFGFSTDSFNNHYFSIGGYQSFQAYTQAVHNANNVTTLFGTGASAGTYNFTATVDGGGNIVAVGNYGTGVTYTITIPPDVAMTDGSGLINYTQSSCIYFCNKTSGGTSGIIVTPDGIDATELNQITHDLFVGYNFGFINSATLDPVTGIAFGAENSQTWQKNATINTLFDKLQPNQPFYNQYAKLIADTSASTVYGFPYSDAIGAVTLFTVQEPGGAPVSAWNILIGEDPFMGASLGSGWYYSAWFGYYNITFYPWVNQLQLGFLYVDTTDGVNLYLYSQTLGWLYTTAQDYPNLYSFTQNSWLYYLTGSINPNYFYNYTTNTWEAY